jgi:hypothetical protein
MARKPYQPVGFLGYSRIAEKNAGDFPSPVPFPGHKSVNAFLLDHTDIFKVCIPVDRF